MISLLVPTRGRPHNVRRFLTTAQERALGEYQVVLRLDNDDPTLDELLELADQFDAKTFIGDRIILSDMLMDAYHVAGGDDDADIFWLQEDEVVFESYGWVEAITSFFAQYPDHLLAAGADEHRGPVPPAYPCCPILTRRWIEVTGHAFPLGFDGDWGDQFVGEVANAVGRQFTVPNLSIQQFPAAMGMAPMDATCSERQIRQTEQDVYGLFVSRAPERQAEVEAIRRLIEAERTP